MTSETVVIESAEYEQDVVRLMKSPIVQEMAEDFKRGIAAVRVTVEWLDSFEGMQAANSHARVHGVTGQSLGAAPRAVKNLVTSDK